jgi:hypothetical protein
MWPRSSLAGKLADVLQDGGWRAKARPEQLPPPGDDWNGWLVMAGVREKRELAPNGSRSSSRLARPAISR